MELDRNHLLNIYDSIKLKKNERDTHIASVSKLDNEIEKDLLEYRIASVSRILDFIHTTLATTGSHRITLIGGEDLDTLITHCCNKINGNIDGIELELGGSSNGD